MPPSTERTDYVFLDDKVWPYYVRQESSGAWWLWMWNEASKTFVSLRAISEYEAESWRHRALSQDRADMYLKYRERLESRAH